MNSLVIGVTAAFIITCPFSSNAMDWETSVEIASYPNTSAYKKVGKRIEAILHSHKIEVVITPSSECIVSVEPKDASGARKLLAAEMKKGLKITLITENSQSK